MDTELSALGYEETFESSDELTGNDFGTVSGLQERDEVPRSDADGVKDGGEPTCGLDHLWTMTMMAYWMPENRPQ